MNETPVLTEAPVRFPRTIRENAFFYFPENEDFLRTHRQIVRVPNPHISTVHTTIKTFVTGPLAILSALLVARFMSEGTSLTFGILVMLFFLLYWGLEVALMKYLEHRNNKIVTQWFFYEGVILNGNIVSSVGSVGSGRRSRFSVEFTYRYVNPDRQRRTGKIKRERPDLNARHLVRLYTFFISATTRRICCKRYCNERDTCPYRRTCALSTRN